MSIKPMRKVTKKSTKVRNQVGPTRANAYKTPYIISSVETAFPQDLLVCLRYVQLTTCAGAGEYGTQVFTINSANAPGGSTTVGTKHQPKGFDQFSVFYNEYLVKGCMITATVSPIGVTAGTVGQLSLTLSDSVGIAWANANDLLEDAKTVARSFGGLGSPACVVTQQWNLSKEVLGGADYRTAVSGQYGALVSAGPADSWYCQVSTSTSTPGGVMAGVAVLVELDMEILFLSRKNIAQS